VDARQFVHTPGLKSSTQWIQYRVSGRKPQDIPSHPDVAYGNDWRGWGDWLGNVAPSEIKLKSFEDARKFVHSLKLRCLNDWEEYCKSGRKPKDIPGNPRKAYKDKFNGINDRLGIDNAAYYNKKYIDFEKAREFVRSLKLKSQAEWVKYRKSGHKPSDIPSNPNRTYKNEWQGFGDWLGTGTIAPFEMEFRNSDHLRKQGDMYTILG
jgi:hypothetical protein